MDFRTWWQKRTIDEISYTILLVGILLLWISNIYFKNSPDLKLFSDSFAVALIIAAILGSTIERIFRQKFAEDAFKNSIGYLLPSELKGEMEWLYHNLIVCVEHDQQYELVPVNPQICIMKVKTYRRLRNVSGGMAKAKLGLSIDEWFYEGHSSKIKTFGYVKNGERQSLEDGTLTAINTQKARITVNDFFIDMEPGEEITVWNEIEEIKRPNDEFTWCFHQPTLNPRVSVKAYAGIRYETICGYRIPPIQLDIDTIRLPGTLLPNQPIIVRWWVQDDVNRWQNIQKTKTTGDKTSVS